MKRGNFQVKFIFIYEDAMLYQIDVFCCILKMNLYRFENKNSDIKNTLLYSLNYFSTVFNKCERII